MADTLVWSASTSAVAGVALLRLGWGRRTRSITLNAVGWGLIALAAVLAWLGAGAWGTSVAALAGTGAAAVLLAFAAAGAPKGKAVASNRRVKMLPVTGEKLRLGRRAGTFLLVGPLAMIVSIGLGVALRGLATALGGSEADANTLGLFTPPLAWALIAYFLLIEPRRSRQALILLVCALPLLPVVAGAAG